MARKLKRMPKRKRPNDTPTIPKNYIRAWRKGEGLTLAELVDKLDTHGVRITDSSLSRMETSKQVIDTRDLAAIGKALKAHPVALLLGRPDDPVIVALNTLLKMTDAERSEAVDMLGLWFRRARRSSDAA